MKQRLLNLIAISLAVCGLTFVVPAAALAASPAQTFASLKNDACQGLTAVDSSQDCGSTDSGVTNLVSSIIKILSLVVGIAAILAIIVAGFKYITSSGDASKISSAKSTLVYALIGLAIAALAQFLVHFTLNTANSATSCPTGQSLTKSGACK